MRKAKEDISDMEGLRKHNLLGEENNKKGKNLVNITINQKRS